MVLSGVLSPGLVQYCSQPSCVIAVFFSRLVSVQVVHPYSSIDTTAAWKKLRFILLIRSDFESLSIAVYAFGSRASMSYSVDETLLPWSVKPILSKFQKILVENTTIIAHEINKLQQQILEALHIKQHPR